MRGQSTNALTARYAAAQGWLCETIQSWRGRVRHDAFGIADSLILTGLHATLVQNCSYGSLKAHRDEIDALPARATILSSGLSLALWEWRRKKLRRGGKNKGREWYLRTQIANVGGGWSEISDWQGPFDLYPKRDTCPAPPRSGE